MATDDKRFGVARVYARALLRLGEEQGVTEEILDELEQLAAYVRRDEEFRAFVASPLIDVDDRRQALEAIFRGRLSDLLVDALQVINRKGRLGLLVAIAEALHQEQRQLRGLVDVHVASAVPLSDELRERLRAAAARYTGRTVELVEKVDPDLLGGLVMRFEDEKIDGSVARELERLSHQLVARASEEILSGKSYADEAGS